MPPPMIWMWICQPPRLTSTPMPKGALLQLIVLLTIKLLSLVHFVVLELDSRFRRKECRRYRSQLDVLCFGGTHIFRNFSSAEKQKLPKKRRSLSNRIVDLYRMNHIYEVVPCIRSGTRIALVPRGEKCAYLYHVKSRGRS